jgi:hypothetical protein
MNLIDNRPHHIGEPCGRDNSGVLCGVADYFHPRPGCEGFVSLIMQKAIEWATTPDKKFQLACLNYLWHQSPSVENAKSFVDNEGKIGGFEISVGFQPEQKLDQWVEEWFPKESSMQLWDFLIKLKRLSPRT